MKCESESDQRMYDRYSTNPEILTEAQKAWLRAVTKREGRKFKV